MRWATLLFAVLVLSGCETTTEKSARLEKQAKHAVLGQARGLTITKPSPYVHILASQIVHGNQATAAVVTLRNSSSRSLRDVPIAITVRGAHGQVLFQNNAAGIEASLTSMPLLRAGSEAIWIDDQVQSGESATNVSAVAGEAQRAPTTIPQLKISGAQMTIAGSSPAASATVTNESGIAQENLVIYALARRGGKIVAAGRAIVPELPGHGSSKFEAFLVGDTRGARLEMNAPATTLR